MALATKMRVHSNPVYGSYLADPFVWRSGGSYFAIGTGSADAAGQTVGKAFTVLQSSDFFNWQFASNALLHPDPALGSSFWAPEVAYHDGRYYLYYSVGHGDKDHRLRVAESASPQGPYRDIGINLVDPAQCAFAIDPHPFQDDDGQWYLFYARDFLETTKARAGTALVVAKLERMTELAGEGKVVLRARMDWQRFQKGRSMYGEVWDWHTLEGPFVRKHDGRYYCFYSGGRWESENYGVDYGISQSVMGPYSDNGNESGPRVLRTEPGRILGPGHNSIVTGPDGRNEYIVYHAWDREMKMRQMFIDPLVWTPEGPRCIRPSSEAQSAG
ncbi:MAG: glycoside hydrolase, family 43 [Pedosphaera sp.]|nr:glycoside hydrolase, family 43 [Pedosphaera sp.]